MAVGPESRYTQALTEYPSCHTYDSDGDIKLDDALVPVVTHRQTVYLFNDALGEPPVKNYWTKETDSFDLLATRQYQDPRRWWVVADANPHVRHPLDLGMGDEINLPS